MAQTNETPVLVAVATKGGGRINLHFGHANEFQIFEVTSASARFIGHRRTDKYCVGGQSDANAFDTTLKALDGIACVLCAKIGDSPREKLAAAGIEATDRYAFEYIEASAITWYAAKARNEATAASA